MLRVSLICLSFVACSSDPKAANESNFTRAIDAYLDKHPDDAALCLPGSLDLRDEFNDENPSAETIGRKMFAPYVAAGLVEVRKTVKVAPAVRRRFYPTKERRYNVYQYRLTTLGKSNTRPGTAATFCYATVRTGKIVSFTVPGEVLGAHVSQVKWTPKIVAVADWAKTPKAKNAFPSMDSTMASTPTEERNDVLQLTNHGWER